MPKGFSEREKELIRKKLLQEGMKLFDKYGVQKTSVDDIAHAAGISKGSFYSFFNSKEELFFDILEDIENRFKTGFFNNVFQDGKPYDQSFREFLYSFFDLMETTPLFQRFNTSDMEYLYRKLPEERIAGHLQKDEDFSLKFFEESQKKGIFKGLNPIALAGIMKLVFFFTVHKEEYKADEYEATKEMLIDMLVSYLIDKKQEKS